MRAHCWLYGGASTPGRTDVYSGTSEYEACSAGPSALFLLVVTAPTTSQRDRIRELIMPTLTFLGYELYDLTLAGSGGNSTLPGRIGPPVVVAATCCARARKKLG